MRLLIINWRWEDKLPLELNIQVDGDLLYCCSYDVKTLNTLLNYIKSKNLKSDDFVLILTHYEPGQDEDSAKKYIKPETFRIEMKSSLKNVKYKIQLFNGSNTKDRDSLYSNSGLLDDQLLDFNKFERGNNQCDKEKYNFVWDEFWNKRDLEYQKKKIINLWLPLAIDIQGLSEVENKNDREAYLTDIFTDIDKNGYIKNLFDGWEEVKKILLPADGKEVLDEKYRLIPKEKEKIKFPVEREKYENDNYKEIGVNTLREFVKSNWKKSKEKEGKERDESFIPNFLPNWLEEVVKVIDGKISKSK